MNIKSKKNKLLTITFNDLNIQWGPAVHFMELWNNMYEDYKNILEIVGIAPHWIKNDNLVLKQKFKLFQIRVPNIPIIRQVIYDVKLMKYLLKNLNADIFYIRLSNYSLFSLFFLLLFKKNKYVLELNGILYDDAKHSNKGFFYKLFVKYMEKIFIKHAKVCIAVSDGIKSFASKYNQNVICIENGVSEQFFKITRNRNTRYLKSVIYVGTFTSWDGHENIFKLAKKFPNINFLIVGGNEEQVKTFRNKYPYDNLKFLGYTPYKDLPDLYKQADAGIVLYEKGFRNNMKLSSLKTLEYIAAGLPVFSTNVPGQEFLFENNIGSEAVEPFEKSFENFINHFPFLKENVLNYREKLRNSKSWKKVAEKTFQIIVKEYDLEDN